MSIWILIDSLSLSLPAGPLFVLGIYSYHFCPLLLVPYRIVMFLYMYNYIVYIYIHIYRYVYIYIHIYRSNFEFFTCQFSSMNMFCRVYIYKYQFVLCPFSFEYLHLLIPTLLGSSALQLEGGSKQTAEKRQEAYFQDRWVVEKMETTCFSKNLTLGQN